MFKLETKYRTINKSKGYSNSAKGRKGTCPDRLQNKKTNIMLPEKPF